MPEHGPRSPELYPLRGKLAVITGSSRGIGAEIAKSLAVAGSNIIGNHVDPLKADRRQEAVMERCRAYGVSAKSVLADITDPDGRQALLDAAVFPTDNYSVARGVDVLVLNAAGGLERDKSSDWAHTINVDAQLALVDDFLPYMNEGGKIIYMTSLWAQRFGGMDMLPGYDPVAKTKFVAEAMLKDRMGRHADMHERGVSLGIVSAHLVEDTAAHLLFKRSNPDLVSYLEKTADGGRLPSAEDVGIAVKDMVIESFPSGTTKYVGVRMEDRV